MGQASRQAPGIPALMVVPLIFFSAIFSFATAETAMSEKRVASLINSTNMNDESVNGTLKSALKIIEVNDQKQDADHMQLWREIWALKAGIQESTQIHTRTTLSSKKPRDCAEIQRYSENPGNLDSSIGHKIFPFGTQGTGVRVKCDFVTEGGGWTIIQRRISGPKEQFYRGWVAYEEGFGCVEKNYWIGLKVIYALTSTSPQELRVELGDWDGQSAFANYGTFSLGSASESYVLSVGEYWGDAGDSLSFHNGKKFSTRDKVDVDKCAQAHHGAWWYSNCAHSSLNGYYFSNSSASSSRGGIHWYHWNKENGYSLKSSEMKIRDLGVL